MDLRYPIGRPEVPDKVEMAHIQKWIEEVAAAPDLLQRSVSGLNEQQLDTPYRPEGWSVRQLVHHLADTHMNTYLNFRLGLTQNVPDTPVHNIDASAQLYDAMNGSIDVSLQLFTALHQRWVTLLESLELGEFERKIASPRGERTLAALLGTYAWHGRHHVAHIRALRERNGW